MLRLARFLAKLILWFVGLSLALVLLFKFVPPPITATMVLDGNGITKDWEPLSNIDRNLVSAVIAGEDGKFCQHNGFDQEAIEKAMVRNLEGGRIRGGSTISQQTAKNVFLWQGGGYFRKGLEAWFTLLIEKGRRRDRHRDLRRGSGCAALFPPVGRAAEQDRGRPYGRGAAAAQAARGRGAQRVHPALRQHDRRAHGRGEA